MDRLTSLDCRVAHAITHSFLKTWNHGSKQLMDWKQTSKIMLNMFFIKNIMMFVYVDCNLVNILPRNKNLAVYLISDYSISKSTSNLSCLIKIILKGRIAFINIWIVHFNIAASCSVRPNLNIWLYNP